MCCRISLLCLSCQALFSHHNTHIHPSSHPSIDKHHMSSQTHFQAAIQSPRSLSSYTRERCGRDPISSSDWIRGSRRGPRELLTISRPHDPPFLGPAIYFFYELLYVSHIFPSIHIKEVHLVTHLFHHLQNASITLNAFSACSVSSINIRPPKHCFKPPSYLSSFPCFCCENNQFLLRVGRCWRSKRRLRAGEWSERKGEAGAQ